MPKSMKELQKETDEMRQGLEESHAVRQAFGKPVPKPRKGAFTTRAMKKAHPQSPKIPAKPYGSNVSKKTTADVMGNIAGAAESRKQQLSRIMKEK